MKKIHSPQTPLDRLLLTAFVELTKRLWVNGTCNLTTNENGTKELVLYGFWKMILKPESEIEWQDLDVDDDCWKFNEHYDMSRSSLLVFNASRFRITRDNNLILMYCHKILLAVERAFNDKNNSFFDRLGIKVDFVSPEYNVEERHSFDRWSLCELLLSGNFVFPDELVWLNSDKLRFDSLHNAIHVINKDFLDKEVLDLIRIGRLHNCGCLGYYKDVALNKKQLSDVAAKHPKALIFIDKSFWFKEFKGMDTLMEKMGSEEKLLWVESLPDKIRSALSNVFRDHPVISIIDHLFGVKLPANLTYNIWYSIFKRFDKLQAYYLQNALHKVLPNNRATIILSSYIQECSMQFAEGGEKQALRFIGKHQQFWRIINDVVASTIKIENSLTDISWRELSEISKQWHANLLNEKLEAAKSASDRWQFAIKEVTIRKFTVKALTSPEALLAEDERMGIDNYHASRLEECNQGKVRFFSLVDENNSYSLVGLRESRDGSWYSCRSSVGLDETTSSKLVEAIKSLAKVYSAAVTTL